MPTARFPEDEPLDQSDDEYPDVDGLSFPELVELRESLEYANAVAWAAGQPIPYPEIGVPPPLSEGVEGSSRIISRAGWGARAPVCRSYRFDWQSGTVHYSGPSPWSGVDRSSAARFQASADHARCPSIWRSYQAYHMDARNGCDIFYSSAACPHGVRLEGRGPHVRSGANGTDIGNYSSYTVQSLMGEHDPLTNASKRAFLDEPARFGAPLRHGHRDWKSTGCPGSPLYQWRLDGFPRPDPEIDVLQALETFEMFRFYTPGKGSYFFTGSTAIKCSSSTNKAIGEAFRKADVGLPVLVLDPSAYDVFRRRLVK